MTEHELEATPDVLFCEVHPERETSLRCNRCGRAMCTACAVRTPVGYRCKECVRDQQKGFYTAIPTDYVIAAVIALILGGIGAAITSAIGFFYLAFFISPVVGGVIGDVIHRAVKRRRGRYTWLVAAAFIVLGALPAGLLTGFGFGFWIYLVMAPGAAIGRLRVARINIGMGR